MRKRSPGAGSSRTSIDARRAAAIWLIAAALLVVGVRTASAQVPSAAPPAAESAAYGIDPSDQPATIVFFNREIVSLRARVLGRRPDERAASAEKALHELVAQHTTSPVELRPVGGGVLITVASRGVVALAPPDVDELTGGSLDQLAAQTAERLRQALADASAARAPGLLVRAIALSLAALVAGAVLLWLISLAHRRIVTRLLAAVEQTAARSGLATLDLVRGARFLELQRRATSVITVTLNGVVVYVVATFILRRFPYTRPWGESMRGFLIGSVTNLGAGIVGALPDLFTVLLIVLVARFLSRLVRLWFDAVERGTINARWIYPETAVPTRRLLTALVWMFTLVMVYPYLPGSQTEAFKGVSVLLGLVITLGSSGLVNQIMSGFMITYSRALRLGDFVKVGDAEGTVVHLGVLSTKIRSVTSEEITVPNAVVIAQTTTDFSRAAEPDGVLASTVITIGYDTPWRQVQALLLQAAERSSGVRREPAPVVLKLALEDYYVRYGLFVCLERQDRRGLTLNELHENILDLFNEHGVQIMSPNYMMDPAAPKIVPRQQWWAAPARPGADDADGAIISRSSASAAP